MSFLTLSVFLLQSLAWAKQCVENMSFMFSEIKKPLHTDAQVSNILMLLFPFTSTCTSCAAMSEAVLPAAASCSSLKLIKPCDLAPRWRLASIINTLCCNNNWLFSFLYSSASFFTSESTITVHQSDLFREYSQQLIQPTGMIQRFCTTVNYSRASLLCLKLVHLISLFGLYLSCLCFYMSFSNRATRVLISTFSTLLFFLFSFDSSNWVNVYLQKQLPVASQGNTAGDTRTVDISSSCHWTIISTIICLEEKKKKGKREPQSIPGLKLGSHWSS